MKFFKYKHDIFNLDFVSSMRKLGSKVQIHFQDKNWINIEDPSEFVWSCIILFLNDNDFFLDLDDCQEDSFNFKENMSR